MTAARRRRVLVADDDPSISRLMCHLLEANGYEVRLAEDGEACLEEAKAFHPDLVLLDVMMRKMHGFDVLKKIKADPKTKRIGVIICTSKGYKADHEQARTLGAFEVIIKPFQKDRFLEIIAGFFTHGSDEGQAFRLEAETAGSGDIYLPHISPDADYLRLWGTRGSTPVSGQKYIRHGGNTSCMQLHSGGEIIIIDAGTGIRDLGVWLMGQKFRRLHLLVTHTHWDHIQGFPFFTPSYVPGFNLVIYGLSGFGKDLKSIFQGQLDRDYFPVQMEDMKANLEFRHLDDKPIEIGDFKITWEFTHHPGATVGFKIQLKDKIIGYVSDNEFLRGYIGPPHALTIDSDEMVPYRKLVKFMTGMDVLVGEAQYTNDEYKNKIGWGHSSLSNAGLLMSLAGIKKWIPTHHDPLHDDEYLQNKLNLTKKILHDLNHPMEVRHAFDGLVEYL